MTRPRVATAFAKARSSMNGAPAAARQTCPRVSPLGQSISAPLCTETIAELASA